MSKRRLYRSDKLSEFTVVAKRGGVAVSLRELLDAANGALLKADELAKLRRGVAALEKELKR